VYGQDRYAERYRHAVRAAGLDYQTLRNYAWVARRFDWPRRWVALSFQHHAEVAALPEAEQDRWLAEAARSRWSRNQLRRALQEARRNAAGQPATAALPRVQVLPERVARWRLAAEQTQSDLGKWVVEALDRAAARVLDQPE
jgi:hypothetical protein